MNEPQVIERAQRMGLRALQVAAACLAVVILVMTVALVMVLGLTRNATQEADRLSEELVCRSAIYSAQEIASAEIKATTAEALTFVARGVPIPMTILDRLEDEIVVLREANTARLNAVETCQ